MMSEILPTICENRVTGNESFDEDEESEVSFFIRAIDLTDLDCMRGNGYKIELLET